MATAPSTPTLFQKAQALPFPGAYRRHPCFSPRWLMLRTLFFLALPLGGLAGAGLACAWNHDGLALPWPAAAARLGGLIVLTCLGPGLATLVRRRGLRARTEKALVALAILAGWLVAWLAMGGASSALLFGLTGTGAPPVAPLGQPGVVLVQVLALGCDLLLGGAFALGAYLLQGTE